MAMLGSLVWPTSKKGWEMLRSGMTNFQKDSTDSVPRDVKLNATCQDRPEFLHYFLDHINLF